MKTTAEMLDLKVGDSLILYNLRVPGTIKNGINFPFLDLKNIKVRIIRDYKGNKLCLFDNYLFRFIANNYECEWEETALCKYLSTVFNKALEDFFECKVETNLLTEYEVFGEGEQKSNFSIYPKQIHLGKDKIAFSINREEPCWYWLGCKSFRSPTNFCIVNDNGYDSFIDMRNPYGGIRPAFLLHFNQERFSGLSLDIAKQNKIIEDYKASIEALYHANGIFDYKLNLDVDSFDVELKGQKFFFDYENYKNPENIKQLKNIQNQKIMKIE